MRSASSITVAAGTTTQVRSYRQPALNEFTYLIRYLHSMIRWRLFAWVALLMVASLLEGFSIGMILPILGGSESADTPLHRFLTDGAEYLGLPYTLPVAVAGAVHLVEAIEDVAELLLGDANPGIGHLEVDAVVAAGRAEDDLACRREAQGVGDEIVEQLGHALDIDLDGGQGVGGVHAQLNALALGCHHVGQPGAFEQSFGIDGAAVERQFTGIDEG